MRLTRSLSHGSSVSKMVVFGIGKCAEVRLALGPARRVNQMVCRLFRVSTHALFLTFLPRIDDLSLCVSCSSFSAEEKSMRAESLFSRAFAAQIRSYHNLHLPSATSTRSFLALNRRSSFLISHVLKPSRLARTTWEGRRTMSSAASFKQVRIALPYPDSPVSDKLPTGRNPTSERNLQSE